MQAYCIEACDLCDNNPRKTYHLQMRSVFMLFWHICLFRQSPQYVPTYPWFVLTVVLLNLAFSVLVSSLMNEDLMHTVTIIVVGQAATAGLTYFACFVRGFTNRFIATITAIFGCDLIVTALVAPLIVFNINQSSQALGWMGLLFVFWSIAINGHIFTRALNIPLSIGVIVALGINILGVAVTEVTVGL